MKEMNLNAQYFASLVVSMLGFLYGLIAGWANPALHSITSNDSPFPTGEISTDEASWVISLKSAGMFIGSLVIMFIMKRFKRPGRKWPLILLVIPSVVSWALIYSAKHVYYLYIARLLHGFITAGTFIFGQLYLFEISNEGVRGALGSSLLLAGHFGIIIAFAIGSYFTYHATPLIAIIVNALFVTMFCIFPESPIYLLKNKKLEESEKSIQFFQNIDANDRKSIDEHIEKLKRQIDNDDTPDKQMEWSALTALMKTNLGKRSMIIGICLAILTHLSANFVLIDFTPNIFEIAGTGLSANESSLIEATIQFIATCMVPFLVERVGRKPLYIISTMGSTLGLTVLGSYVMLKSWNCDVESVSWIPIASLSVTVFVQSLAISILAFVVAVETLPDTLREFGMCACSTVMAASSFVVLKFTPFLCEFIGLHGALFVYGGFCTLGTLFVIVYVPETKNKSYQEIMNSLQ